MIKPNFNPTKPSRAASKQLAAMLFFLALFMILTLVGDYSPAVAAQEPGHTVYLPLILRSGAAPAGPYAQMLQMAQQKCGSTGLNQVCYVNGQVTLQPRSGSIPFSQPGALAGLANVQSLSLASTGPDFQKWGMAWMRLKADSPIPNQELTILAFGNVQISNITSFESQASLIGTVTLPSLQFASSPVAGVTKWGSSGLIVINPADEEILSLTLNGAGISFGSTAFVEAQPGNKMTVTMMTGTSLAEAKDQSSSAVQGYQVSVPLGQNGQVSGPPALPVAIDPSLVPEPIDESLIPMPLSPEAHLTRLNRAIDRCIAGRATYVYNVLYRVHIIEKNPTIIKARIDPAKLAQAYNRASNCLSFEVDFDSNTTAQVGPLFQSSHVRTEGLPVQFLVDGRFIAANTSLDYLNFVYIPPASPCATSTSTIPGELEMAAGSLKIAGNKVKISMSLKVVKEAKDLATITCPHAPPIEAPDNWWIFFFNTHRGPLGEPDLRTFRFNDWKYTAASSQCSEPSSPCNHFGEATYEFSLEAEATTATAATHLILIHTPEP